MAQNLRTWTLAQIAEAVGGTLAGPSDQPVIRAVPAGYNDPHAVTFAGNEAYLQKALSSQVGAVLVPVECPEVDKPVIRVPNPRAAFGIVLAVLRRPLPLNPGIHPTAVVSPGAQIDETAQIGPFAVVESRARIEAGAQIFPHAYVGENCLVGENSVLYPGVVLYQDVQLGKNCILHSGVVLGADGFGFAWNGQHQQKIPQIGGVILGDNVEIGANSAVDRATCGETVLGNGVKLDNLVQIGHNVEVGDHTVMAAQVAIGGSSTVGQKVTIGGQAALSDHVSVPDETVLGGRTGVVSTLEQPGEYFGLPPAPVHTAMRTMALQQRLPELFQRLRALEKQVKELQNEQNISPTDPQ